MLTVYKTIVIISNKGYSFVNVGNKPFSIRQSSNTYLSMKYICPPSQYIKVKVKVFGL